MGSPKSGQALGRLGRDLRAARLRRGMAVADLAVRSGVSASTLGRLEKGETGVAIGALADVLVALGLIERLADVADVRSDVLGLGLTEARLPQRGRSSGAARRRETAGPSGASGPDVVDPDGAAF